ncbi:MAG: molybdopterin-dependent oxidoreductase, partial [Calditrichia bacterium]
YGAGFNAYLSLMKKSAPLSALRKAPVILCIGLDTRFGRSVIGVELRRAVQRGAKVITVHPHQHNLSLISHKWLQPAFGEEANLLLKLTEMAGEKGKGISAQKSKGNAHPQTLMDDLVETAELLRTADTPVILIGSEFLQYNHGKEILEAADELAEKIHAGVFPLPAQNNLLGSILMGAYPEFLPGGFSSSNKKHLQELKKIWNAQIPAFIPDEIISTFSNGRKLKVLYLMGEFPPAGYPPADYLISQNIFPLEGNWKTDLALPAAAFTESDGTFVNGEGRVQRAKKAVDAPGAALPDWQILCRIAQKMGVAGFDFKNAAEIHREISQFVPGFENFEKPGRNPSPLDCEGKFIFPEKATLKRKRTNKKFPIVLRTSIPEHTHRGFSLSSRVDGAKKLFPEETITINSQDARRKHISDGDRIMVKSPNFDMDWRATISDEQPSGTLHINLPMGESLERNPHPVSIRKKNV